MNDSVPDLEVVDGMDQLTLDHSSHRPFQPNSAENLSNNSDDDDDMEEDYEEPEMVQSEPVSCFFCLLSDTPETILAHCLEKHNCDFRGFARKNRLPTEEIIRMVNFFRKTRPSPEGLAVNISTGSWTDSDLRAFRNSWVDDIWMTPVDSADHGIVSCLIWDWDTPDDAQASAPFPLPSAVSHGMNCLQDHGDGCSCLLDAAQPGRKKDDEDARNSSYFDSYSGFNIHCEMLRDRVRTEAYRDAIFASVAGKSVLDIGCGSGVLSCFAAQAGARSVTAVDKADIIDYAQAIALENGLADRIRFIHADLDKTRLPIEKVDVIVSEWMGYFLLFEGMLDSVLLARDKYLAPNGTMIPSRASLFLTAISDMESWETRVGLWDNAYGLRFRCLKDHSLKFPGVDEVRDEHVVTSRSTLREWDLMTCTTRDLEFETRVMVRVLKTSSLTALVGFFDVGYNNPTAGLQTMLCTGPSFPVTHWAQSVFYLEKPFPVTEGQELNIATRIMKCRDDHRGLEVTFRIFNGEGVGNNLEETCLWQQTYQL